jgi:hypothetical protein
LLQSNINAEGTAHRALRLLIWNLDELLMSWWTERFANHNTVQRPKSLVEWRLLVLELIKVEGDKVKNIQNCQFILMQSYFGLERNVVMKVHRERHPCSLLIIVHAKRDPPNLLLRNQESPDLLNK